LGGVIAISHVCRRVSRLRNGRELPVNLLFAADEKRKYFHTSFFAIKLSITAVSTTVFITAKVPLVEKRILND
jgi:hypothetical protein